MFLFVWQLILELFLALSDPLKKRIIIIITSNSPELISVVKELVSNESSVIGAGSSTITHVMRLRESRFQATGRRSTLQQGHLNYIMFQCVFLYSRRSFSDYVSSVAKGSLRHTGRFIPFLSTCILKELPFRFNSKVTFPGDRKVLYAASRLQLKCCLCACSVHIFH